MDLYDKFYLDKRAEKIVKYVLLFLILGSIVCIFNPSAYEILEDDVEARYVGIFVAGNTSASMFTIFSIFLWELYKRENGTVLGFKGRLLLLFLFAALIVYFIGCKTRTLAFAVPYWIYQFYLVYGRKALIITLLLVLPLAGGILGYLQEYGRMDEDSSYLTRMSLYMTQIDGIMENKVVIPHGANAAVELIREQTGDDTYSPHNDFLRYIYDWGAIFFILLWYIFRKIKKRIKVNANFLLILLAYISFALHNLIFLPYVWIPFFFILVIIDKKNKKTNPLYEKNVSGGKEI